MPVLPVSIGRWIEGIAMATNMWRLKITSAGYECGYTKTIRNKDDTKAKKLLAVLNADATT